MIPKRISDILKRTHYHGVFNERQDILYEHTFFLL